MIFHGVHSIEARLPSSLGAYVAGMSRNGGGWGSFQPPAKNVDSACWSCRRMLIVNADRLDRCRARLERLLGQNMTSMGSSETDETALAVMARTSSPALATITATPVANIPMVLRNCRASGAAMVLTRKLRRGLPSRTPAQLPRTVGSDSNARSRARLPSAPDHR